MQIRIGLENEFEGRSLAWVLDFPGCFAYGKDGSEAILRVPQALLFFQEWLSEKTEIWVISISS
jgi:predicted RNase H-like HicB family nuclease